MPDFTIKRYLQLLKSLQSGGFSFLPFVSFLHKKEEIQRLIILRHDIDALPENSLRLARMEHELRIRGTYYFRMVPGCYEEAVMREIASLGHEIGYHYETLATIGEKGTERRRDEGTERLRNLETKKQEHKGNRCIMLNEKQMLDDAYQLFIANLEKLRKIVPIETICMHGSPHSRFDNRDIWKKYDYRKLGIIGEASMDIDFTNLAYYTDTGRRWDGAGVSIRDKVDPGLRDGETEGRRDKGTKRQNIFPIYHTTFDMIKAIENGTLPDQAMLTIHPQRWNDAFIPWVKELVWQNIKNCVKRGMVTWRQDS